MIMMTITKLETHVRDVSIDMVLPKQSLTVDDYLFSNLFDSLNCCYKHYIFEISPMTEKSRSKSFLVSMTTKDKRYRMMNFYICVTKAISYLTLISMIVNHNRKI